MESSDDSFVWMSASSVISDQSDEMQPVVADTTKQYYDGESESGSNYKNKLQKALLDIYNPGDFCAEEVQPRQTNKRSIKQEPDIDSSREKNVKTEPESDIDLKQKKRKSKHREKENGTQYDSQGSACDDGYLDMRVKLEDSAIAQRKSKKKKKKHKSELDLNIVFENHSEGRKSKKHIKHNDFNELDQTDRVNRTNQVKIESAVDESHQTKKKKSKKRRHSDTPDAKDMIIEEKFTAEETVVETRRQLPANDSKKRRHSDTPDAKDMIIEEKFTAEETVVETRRQLPANDSKKSKHSDTPDAKDMIIEEKFTAEETVVESRDDDSTRSISGATRLKSKQINSYSSKEFISEESSSDGSTELHEVCKASSYEKKTNSGTYEKSEESNTISNGNGYNTETPTDLLLANDSHRNKVSQCTSKISDRIRFEDEIDIDETDQDHPCIADVHSTEPPSFQLRRFLKAKPDLKPLVFKSENGSLITQDDELWLFECPSEIDIKGFEGSDLVLGNRCRIKIEGQTYEGRADAGGPRGHVAVLCAGAGGPHDTACVKNFALHGLVHFRKKIPKAHFVEDSVMTNNQTNFIPLPETKCRHPLFGRDYKRAAKIPSVVKQRLKAVEVDRSTTRTDRKRKKKHRKESSAEERSGGAPEPAGRKRRRAHDPEPPPIKAKRKKHELGSAEAWESAKAIEENLFNF